MKHKSYQGRAILRYELRQEVRCKKKQYIFPMLLALWHCILQWNRTKGSLEASLYVERFLEGMPTVIPGSMNSFLIPGDWLLFLVVLLYFNGKFAKDFTRDMGLQLLVRSESAVQFWNAKWLLCVYHVCLYYIAAYICIVGFVMISGRYGAVPSGMLDKTLWTKVGLQLVLPILAMSALCIWQLVLSYLTGFTISTLLVCTLLIVSAYFTKWYLPGNLLMKIRVQELLAEGIGIRKMVLYTFFLLAGGILAGYCRMKRMDYIP
ncbi:MAG TPA: hypothetical protein DCZ20_02930 [Lachnospiraceae bacterium]|nr:hypothetical protein [Lachnospiraceae bacterium]